jgi:hypothetical protein
MCPGDGTVAVVQHPAGTIKATMTALHRVHPLAPHLSVHFTFFSFLAARKTQVTLEMCGIEHDLSINNRRAESRTERRGKSERKSGIN